MKIPKGAKKVFEGVIFDVYQWQQKMFDGSFKTFEMIKREYSTNVFAITKEKKIIILKEEQPSLGEFLSLPGGRVERNEVPIENAKKELLEECGVKSLDFFLWKEVDVGGKMDYSTFYYIAKNCEFVSSQNIESEGERIEIMELNFEEFLKIVENKDFRDTILRDIIFRLKHTEGELEKFKKLLFD